MWFYICILILILNSQTIYNVFEYKFPEYNPKLEEQTVATRVAYVKFMQKTLEKREQESEGKEEEGDGGDEAKKRTASKRDPEVI